MRRSLTTLLCSSLLLALAVTQSAAAAKPKPAAKAHKGKVLTADAARIKQLHDSKIKTALGLPTFAFHGDSASTISNKWTEGFSVSPAVTEWVTDYGEADESAYRVRLSKIKFPDGTVKSLYTDDQKKELFSNLIGHLYKVKPAELVATLQAPELQELEKTFAEKIDDGGFDFPKKIVLKG